MTESRLHLVRRDEMTESIAETRGLAAWLIGAVGRVSLAWAQQRPARKHMRVVETMNLGGRRQLLLVSCNGERFLVGSGPDAVQTVTRVRPDSSAASLGLMRGGDA